MSLMFKEDVQIRLKIQSQNNESYDPNLPFPLQRSFSEATIVINTQIRKLHSIIYNMISMWQGYCITNETSNGSKRFSSHRKQCILLTRGPHCNTMQMTPALLVDVIK